MLMTFLLLIMLCYSIFYIILNLTSSFFDRILDTQENENDEDDSDTDAIL